MRTVYGIALDGIGHASSGGKHWATPANKLCTVQDAHIAVDVEHGAECGRVIYLEKRGGNIWAVAEVADEVTPEVRVRLSPVEVRSVPTEFYWSVSRIGDDHLGYALTGLALTWSPARVGARPVTFRDGNAARAASKASDPFERELLHRASEYDLRRHGGPLMVVGNDTSLIEPRRPRIECRFA
jgi:hypothetical protein